MVGPGLGWGAVVEAGMGSLAIVKYSDVFGHCHACPGPCGKDLLVVHFVFQAGEKRFGYGIIPAHSGASHRLGDPCCSAVRRQRLRGILRAMIGINPNSG